MKWERFPATAMLCPSAAKCPWSRPGSRWRPFLTLEELALLLDVSLRRTTLPASTLVKLAKLAAAGELCHDFRAPKLFLEIIEGASGGGWRQPSAESAPPCRCQAATLNGVLQRLHEDVADANATGVDVILIVGLCSALGGRLTRANQRDDHGAVFVKVRLGGVHLRLHLAEGTSPLKKAR